MDFDEIFTYAKAVMIDQGFHFNNESNFSYKDLEIVMSFNIIKKEITLDSDTVAHFFKEDSNSISLYYETFDDLEEVLTYYCRLMKKWQDQLHILKPFREEAIEVLKELNCGILCTATRFRYSEVTASAPITSPFKLHPTKFCLDEIEFGYLKFKYDSTFRNQFKTVIQDYLEAYS